MGLPVGRIMEEVEHELRHMDDELSDEVNVNMEVDDNMENELDGIILEVVDGIKEGSRWLIVDDVHICHKQQVFKGHNVWRCEDFRSYRCPFKIVTTKEEGENELRIVSMTKAIVQNCSKDKVKPIIHKMLRLWQNWEKANIQLLFLACVWQLAALHSADSDDTLLAGSLPHFKSQGIYDVIVFCNRFV